MTKKFSIFPITIALFSASCTSHKTTEDLRNESINEQKLFLTDFNYSHLDKVRDINAKLSKQENGHIDVAIKNAVTNTDNLNLIYGLCSAPGKNNFKKQDIVKVTNALKHIIENNITDKNQKLRGWDKRYMPHITYGDSPEVIEVMNSYLTDSQSKKFLEHVTTESCRTEKINIIKYIIHKHPYVLSDKSGAARSSVDSITDPEVKKLLNAL